MDSIRNEKKIFIKMFLDFDKKIKRFYINYYFEENKYVMKELLIKDKNQRGCVKIDKFDITKNVYLISIE